MKLQNLEKPSAAVSDTVDVIADSNYSNVSKHIIMHSVHGGTKKITHMPFAARNRKRSGLHRGKRVS